MSLLPLSLLPLIGSALLPLAAQVGPFTAPGTRGTPLPEPVARPARSTARSHAKPAPLPTPAAHIPARLAECLDIADDDADSALDQAEAWSKQAKGHDLAEAQLCLGTAQARLDNWREAEQAFLAGRELAGGDRLLHARLSAMAGNAALAVPAPDRALAVLDSARSDAVGLADAALTATIALDRARALVALKRPGEAETALGEARAAQPASVEAWLLSATLSRRQGKLAGAQQRIERAADLRPVDPDIGLEAGVIAMLAGQSEAARKSWESVLTVAPDSPAAATARGYLAQLGPRSTAPAGMPPARAPSAASAVTRN